MSGGESALGVFGSALDWFGGPRGRRRAAALGLAAVVFGSVPAMATPMNSDVAWLLYAAERWLDGAHLYVDVVETNPPLVVWVYAPAAWVERAVGVPALAAFLPWAGLLVGGSIALAARALRSLELGEDPARRRCLVLLFVVGLFLLSGRSFGQKDHLAVALTLPYVLTLVARAEGAAVPRRLALTAGGLAVLGVGLKPHFLLLPAALEAMRRLSPRGSRRWWRVETTVLLGGLALYALVVFAAVPEYVAQAQRFGALYVAHVQLSAGDVTSHPATALLAVGWMTHLVARDRSELGMLNRGLLVAGTAFLFAAALQMKGWSYHFLPALIFGAWAVGSGIGLAGHARSITKTVRAVSVVVLSLFLLVAAWSIVSIAGARSEEEVRLERVAGALAGCGEGDVLAVLSPRIDSAFPLVNLTGMTWGLRHHSQWALTVWKSAERRTSGERVHRAGALWRRMKAETVADLTSNPPARLLLDERALARTFSEPAPDLLNLYREEPAFEALMSAYRPGGEVAGYRSWHRRGDAANEGSCLSGEKTS